MMDLAVRLRDSGYDEVYRGEIISDAVIGYERQVAASERGEKPLYRPREWRKEERQERKLLSKAAWFRTADSVSFIPATPGGELASEMRKVLEEEGKRLSMNIRVIEKSGTKLKNELFKPDLRAGEPCGIPNCIMDMVRDEEGGQRGCCHHKAGALYKAVCTLCEKEGTTAEYFGESGSSGYTRGLEHLAAVRNDQPSKSALAKHLREYHPQKHLGHQCSDKMCLLLGILHLVRVQTRTSTN